MERKSIDHSILSPSGKVSKRAREAALERERARLFPPGFWDKPEPSATDITTRERERALRRAMVLREMASRGFGPIKHAKEADRLERDWLDEEHSCEPKERYGDCMHGKEVD